MGLDVNLVKRLVSVAGDAGKPWTVVNVGDILLALIEGQEEQNAVLRSIKRDVDLLRNGPWNTGLEYLGLASRPGQPAELVYDYLMQARSSLMNSVPLQEPYTLPHSNALYALALVMTLLGDLEAAREYAHDSWCDLFVSLPSSIQKAGDGVAPFSVRGLPSHIWGYRSRVRSTRFDDPNIAALFRPDSLPDAEWLKYPEVRQIVAVKQSIASCQALSGVRVSTVWRVLSARRA